MSQSAIYHFGVGGGIGGGSVRVWIECKYYPTGIIVVLAGYGIPVFLQSTDGIYRFLYVPLRRVTL